MTVFECFLYVTFLPLPCLSAYLQAMASHPIPTKHFSLKCSQKCASQGVPLQGDSDRASLGSQPRWNDLFYRFQKFGYLVASLTLPGLVQREFKGADLVSPKTGGYMLWNRACVGCLSLPSGVERSRAAMQIWAIGHPTRPHPPLSLQWVVGW